MYVLISLHNNYDYLFKVRFYHDSLNRKYTCIRQATHRIRSSSARFGVYARDFHISCKNDNSRKSQITYVRVAHGLQINLGVSADLFIVGSRRAKEIKESCASIAFFRTLTLSFAFFGHFLLTEDILVPECERVGPSFFV